MNQDHRHKFLTYKLVVSNSETKKEIEIPIPEFMNEFQKLYTKMSGLSVVTVPNFNGDLNDVERTINSLITNQITINTNIEKLRSGVQDFYFDVRRVLEGSAVDN